MNALLDASATPQGPVGKPSGDPASFQSHYGTTSKKQLTSKSLLERFWGVSETVFEDLFKVAA